MMSSGEEFLEMALSNRKTQGGLRVLRGPCDQRELVDFTSNDYLGYARNKQLREIIQKRLGECWQGNGSTGSRLLTGNSELMESVEKKISSFHRAEAGAIFNSGYDANLGLFSSVLDADDILILDEQVHSSIRDGAKLSGCQRWPFRHNDLDHLEKRLKKVRSVLETERTQKKKKRKAMLAVESVYSMDGDLAPLQEMAALCETYSVLLVVDEAHATGIFGEQGEGLVVQENLEQRVFARVHTFGKALGTHGAIVLGSRILKEYLINFSRPFIYTTALPPHSFQAIQASYDFLLGDREGRQNLQFNIQYFNELLQEKFAGNGQTSRSAKNLSPIFPFYIPHSKEKLFQVQQFLREKGMNLSPILSPTVQKGKERLRICIHSFNSKEEMKGLVENLGMAFSLPHLCLR